MGSVSSIRKPYHIGFYLCDSFTMLSMASAVEVLRMANQLSGETLYRWYTLSDEGTAVSASDSLTISVDEAIPTQLPLDAVIVCGGIDIEKHCSQKLLSWWVRWTKNIARWAPFAPAVMHWRKPV